MVKARDTWVFVVAIVLVIIAAFILVLTKDKEVEVDPVARKIVIPENED